MVPEELLDSELCETYGWTWKELQETPYYVRVAFMQIQQMKNVARNQAQERAAAESGGATTVSYA